MKSSISHTMQPGRGRNQTHQHGYGHRHPNQYLRRRPSSLFGIAWEGLFSAMLIERVMRPWAMSILKQLVSWTSPKWSYEATYGYIFYRVFEGYLTYHIYHNIWVCIDHESKCYPDMYRHVRTSSGSMKRCIRLHLQPHQLRQLAAARRALDNAICHHLPSCAQCVTRFLQSLLDIWTDNIEQLHSFGMMKSSHGR